MELLIIIILCLVGLGFCGGNEGAQEGPNNGWYDKH